MSKIYQGLEGYKNNFASEGSSNYSDSGFNSKYSSSSNSFSKSNSQKSSSYDEIPNYEDFSDLPQKQTYKKGMKVRHPTFGAGTIYQIEGSGEAQKVSVLFTNSTLKKFVIKYARLEII